MKVFIVIAIYLHLTTQNALCPNDEFCLSCGTDNKCYA